MCPYYRVLNRARQSALAAARFLPGFLAATFAPTGTRVFGPDDMIERRHRDNIAAKSMYRDLARISHVHFAKASGLRFVIPRD
ncbi:MAG TPA: hypothetical protein VNO70_26630 [Blastocatellia bacterium]|nr:hypothetical protein [Blastocatellia bacterium]